MAGGYMAKMLFVDLTYGSIKEETLDEALCRVFLGGTGIGARILYERQKPKVDPLGPDNFLGFLTGPLTGTPVPSASRYMVVTKSPLTGGWGDVNSGGYTGRELKAAGYDAIFFSGVSPKPVYLFVHDGEAKLKDAAHLWGKDTADIEESLIRELGAPEIKAVCIGQAGELLSLMSGVVSDKGRLAARSGVGAVMGSKRLKAIALRGTRRILVADRAWLSQLRKVAIKEQRGSTLLKRFTDFGTCDFTKELTTGGDTAIKNWSLRGYDNFPNVDKLSGEVFTKYQLRRFACFGCPIACGGILKVEQGPFAVEEAHKPEYETCASFGTNCLCDNAEAIIKLNDLCNRYGLDTISTGSVIAFVMECYKRGILTKTDTDGIEITWGNIEAMVEMVKKISKREGFGAVLADGVKRASEQIGRGSEAFAIHIHGQEPGFHCPTFAPGRGTTYIVDPTPARHTVGESVVRMEMGGALGKYPELQPPEVDRFDCQHKGQMHATAIAYFHALNASGICLFPYLSEVMPLVEYIAAVTGWDYTISELLTTGERIQTLRHAFNLREGLKPQDFRLPDRLAGRASALGGPLASITVDEDSLKREYYKAMQWDLQTGHPSGQRLAQLGLKDLLRDLS